MCAWQGNALLAAIAAGDPAARAREATALAEVSQRWISDKLHWKAVRTQCRDLAAGFGISLQPVEDTAP